MAVRLTIIQSNVFSLLNIQPAQRYGSVDPRFII